MNAAAKHVLIRCTKAGGRIFAGSLRMALDDCSRRTGNVLCQSESALPLIAFVCENAADVSSRPEPAIGHLLVRPPSTREEEAQPLGKSGNPA